MSAVNVSAQFPEEQSSAGTFERQEDAFRDRVSTDPAGPRPAGVGRYHLYVSLACPWACRTVIVRLLAGLESAVGMTVVDPIRDERGWAFRDGPGYSADPVNGFAFLSEAYEATKPGYRGRVTVPVLWDKVKRRIVNNSEDDICRMFNDSFAGLGTPVLAVPRRRRVRNRQPKAAIELEHRRHIADDEVDLVEDRLRSVCHFVSNRSSVGELAGSERPVMLVTNSPDAGTAKCVSTAA